jgi:hypothetical protein
MKSHYNCGKCGLLLESSDRYFYPHSLKKVSNNSNLTVIGQCKSCAKEYCKKRRSAIKAKGLVRSQKTTSFMAGAVTGTIYVIGPDIPSTPYKIGITSGSDTRKRKSALQTAHWMELKEVWKSNVFDRADLIEKKLHKHFEKQRVRGEWFNITKADITDIPNLIEQFRVKE